MKLKIYILHKTEDSFYEMMAKNELLILNI